MALGTVGTVRVHGIVELRQSFGKYGKDLKKGLDRELKAVAEPVRFEASSLARSEFSRMGRSGWDKMRVGYSVKEGIVWVAPVKRGIKGDQADHPLKRSKPGQFPLLEKALEPALEHNRHKIEARVDVLLDVIAAENGFLV